MYYVGNISTTDIYFLEQQNKKQGEENTKLIFLNLNHLLKTRLKTRL